MLCVRLVKDVAAPEIWLQKYARPGCASLPRTKVVPSTPLWSPPAFAGGGVGSTNSNTFSFENTLSIWKWLYAVTATYVLSPEVTPWSV